MTRYTGRHRQPTHHTITLTRALTLGAVLAVLLLGALLTGGKAHAATRGPDHSNGAWTCERVPSVLHYPGNLWCHKTRWAQAPHRPLVWPQPTTKPTPTGTPSPIRFVPMGG